MAERVTKDDLNVAVERLIDLMQESFARIDQRFDEMNARFDNQAMGRK